MKKFVQLAALVLALTLLLSLAACKKDGASKAPDTVVGKWSGRIDIDTLMQITAEAGAAEEKSVQVVKTLVGDSGISMLLELTADGVITFALDRASVEALLDTMIENIPAHIPEITGFSIETFEAALQAKGMTMADFQASMRQQFESANLAGSLEGSTAKGIYALEGDRIYVGKEGKAIDKTSYMVYELKDGALILKELVGDAGSGINEMQVLLPWTFTRIG